jgi:hypothetical protein
MRVHAFCAALALGVTLAASPVSAQPGKDPFEPTLGSVILTDLSSAFDNYRQAKRLLAEQEAEIDRARQRYWKAFPAGPDYAAAKAEFSRQLFAKDFWYLLLNVPQGPPSSIPAEWGGPRTLPLDRMLAMDGGIRADAADAFETLVKAVRYDLGARREGQLVIMLNLPGALQANGNYVDAYVRARDFAEYQASGRDVRQYLNPKAYALTMIQRRIYRGRLGGGDTSRKPPNVEQEARETYTMIARAIGEQNLLSAAQKILDAPKTARGELQNAVSISTWEGNSTTTDTVRWFDPLVAQTSAKAYAVSLFLPPLGDYPALWRIATNQYDQVVSAFGEPKVLAATERIRTAPKGLNRVTIDGKEMSTAEALRTLVAGASGRFPFDEVIPRLESIDLVRIRERADKGVGAQREQTMIVGIVESATPETLGNNSFPAMQFAGVPGSDFVVVANSGSPRLEVNNFVGKTIEVTGTPTLYPDGRLIMFVNPAQVKLAAEQRPYRPRPAPAQPPTSAATPISSAIATAPAARGTSRVPPVTQTPSTAKHAGIVPPGTPLMIRFLEPVDLLNPNEATYRGSIERAIASGGATVVAAGSAAVIKAVRKTQPGSRANVVYLALTVESILQNESTIPITTREVLKPSPVPGTQYRGAPVMPAQTVLFFTVGSN